MKNLCVNEVISEVSKEEFCRFAHTKADCWIFQDAKDIKFYKCITDTGEESYLYIGDGGQKIMEFKDMPKYGEIWCRIPPTKRTSHLWNTWTIYE